MASHAPLSGGASMLGALYHAYEARRLSTQPLYLMAALTTKSLQQLPAPLAASPFARYGMAVTETVSSLRLTHERPAFGIDSVLIEDRPVPVAEEVVTSTPFGSLVRFTTGESTDSLRGNRLRSSSALSS